MTTTPALNADSLQGVLDRSYKYLKAANLRPFLLTLPLHGAAAKSNQEGIREKIMKNKSQVVTDQNPESKTAKINPESVKLMNQVADRLTSEDIVGFVMVIAEYLGVEEQSNNTSEHNNELSSTAAYQYRPVAGGIVELLDEYERAVRAVWCRRSLPNTLTDEFLKVIVMRIIAHAFEWQHPSKPNKKVSSKLVSSLEIHSLAFPTETYDFLTKQTGLNLSKHWETEDDGGAHNDSPNQKCKCFKLADKEGAWQFWGISESRFLKAWTLRKDSLIPLEPNSALAGMFLPAKNSPINLDTKSNKRDSQHINNTEDPSSKRKM